MPLHAIQRRYLAEDLVRKRRAGEHQRSGSTRRGRIDPNPHQIDAVMFALARLPEGGCILADEVGLGKTIEAGLVIAQRLAEGAQRILLIVPTSLVPQWQSELSELFGIATRDGTSEPLSEAGTFLVSRDWAGTERGAARLAAAEPFELCLIDEAHEIFAAIHKRYDKDGLYLPGAKEAVMAHRVHEAIGFTTPILLLTATPIQNSLAELWGLVQYVEPTGTLLGNLATFRQIFCAGDDRWLVPEQAAELKERLDLVLKRTLRRDAQAFLEHPFVPRRARLYEYTMTAEERSLYDDVTAYLLEPDLCAFAGSSRRLLLIGFHRRMASSSRALASSLNNVALRLERFLLAEGQSQDVDFVREEFADLEEEGFAELDVASEAQLALVPSANERPARDRVERELERVRGFCQRAEKLPYDSKAAALLQAVKTAQDWALKTGASGKVVVFTESRVTQRYLRELLMSAGNVADEDITLFSSSNDTPRATEALQRWQEEVGKARADKPKRQLAVRAALVHEFRSRSRVFISTEAGAKGLNLQFCETLINYDLPWNPQRIEQRIGRCHRYGQKHEVMVVNFTARDNEAQRLTFEILSRKLDLFGTVLDASDQVLHEAGTEASEALVGVLGVGFERSLSEIYERARSREDLAAGLRRLGDDTEEAKRFNVERERTARVIETRLHERVRERFASIQAALPTELLHFDAQLEGVATAYLDARGVSYSIAAVRVEGELSGASSNGASARVVRVLSIAPNECLPTILQAELRLCLGGALRSDVLPSLHPAHPLIAAAVADARATTVQPGPVTVVAAGTPFADKRGQRGVLLLEQVTYSGFEDFERLLVVVVLEDGTILTGAEGEALFQLAMIERDVLEPALSIAAEAIADAVEEALFLDQRAVTEAAQERFESALLQLERYLADQVLVQRRRQRALSDQIALAEAARDAAVGSSARAQAEARCKQLQLELEVVDDELLRLSDRKDERFEKCTARAHQRRYSEPTRRRLLAVELAVQ